MIIASYLEKEIGKIHTPKAMTDIFGKFITPQPLFFIREATAEEYLAQSKENPEGIFITLPNEYYYEVSTD